MGHRNIISKTWRCEIWDTGLQHPGHGDVSYETEGHNIQDMEM